MVDESISQNISRKVRLGMAGHESIPFLTAFGSDLKLQPTGDAFETSSLYVKTISHIERYELKTQIRLMSIFKSQQPTFI